MKVIVTGGKGFIGTHLINKLLQEGHEVTCVDISWHHSDVHAQMAKTYKTYSYNSIGYYNITKQHHMRNIFKKIKPDICYHLAAQTSVRNSIKKVKVDATENIIGTINVLDACVTNKVKKVIFTSSGGTVYKNDGLILKKESDELDPESPYGMSKMTCENYIRLYSNLKKLDYCTLRLSNVYGPGQDPKNECGVIAIFLQAMKNNQTLKVFGDGIQSRDYVYIDDVVSALMMAQGLSGTYNVSTGINTSVNELLQILNCHNFKNIKDVPGEIRHNSLDASKLKSHGWEPITDIVEGINKTKVFF
jgi:UDP-glucose 4-epimerase